jgi:hypothetical protein
MSGPTKNITRDVVKKIGKEVGIGETKAIAAFNNIGIFLRKVMSEGEIHDFDSYKNIYLHEFGTFYCNKAKLAKVFENMQKTKELLRQWETAEESC